MFSLKKNTKVKNKTKQKSLGFLILNKSLESIQPQCNCMTKAIKEML